MTLNPIRLWHRWKARRHAKKVEDGYNYAVVRLASVPRGPERDWVLVTLENEADDPFVPRKHPFDMGILKAVANYREFG